MVEESKRRIQRLLGMIDTEVEELDKKLDNVLEKHEKDFLTAYRVCSNGLHQIVPYVESAKGAGSSQTIG